MKIKLKNREIEVTKLICLVLYYGFAQHLPKSHTFFNIGGKIRYQLCKHIFKYIGKNVNIETGAWFGMGNEIEIGDFSGLGIRCHIPNGTIIGKYVMMGPNCWIHDVNHIISNINKPMCFQGMEPKKTTIIDDDVWIGINVSMTPGRHISKGSVVAMCSVLTKDFPPYSIVGGAPAKLIRSRIR